MILSILGILIFYNYKEKLWYSVNNAPNILQISYAILLGYTIEDLTVMIIFAKEQSFSGPAFFIHHIFGILNYTQFLVCISI